ncbi:SCARECROW-like 21 [Actinidia rufa]|uniref:SCARECROW-like 21 n=1 Tax=Actinidia rufa TaxID=165716 RepID=A0A7J0EXK5_9ERIC|nr:SCARECROW-like 21 [Actinidia rufa]
MQQIETYCFSPFHMLTNDASPQNGSQTAQVSFQSDNEQYFTLESSPATDYLVYDSPCTVSISSNRTPMSQLEAVSDENMSTAGRLMDVLEGMVSVFGNPIERLGAYLLEGLRARMLSSGSVIYKKLKCKEPTGSELMTYMHVLYEICPYYKFAYNSANVVICEAMANESRMHIIDFQIAQGSQWSGGLEIVGQRLSNFAASCGVPFEFNSAAMSGCEVELDNLQVRRGEALAVNFPYMLHHMPDEGVSTRNHRDRLLRLVKSLSPKVVTLLEQESNTNTSAFLPRFHETLDYYTAMFESIDAARPRDDKERMSAEQHCVARDIVNIIACEGAERLERHEPLGKWRSRLMMAGFAPCRLSPDARIAVKEVLKGYSKNFRAEEMDGASFLCWKNRVLSTSSAWR